MNSPILPVEKFSALSEQEKNNIIYRNTLDTQKVLADVIMPMADVMRNNTLQALKDYSLKFDKNVPEPLMLTRKHLQAAHEKVHKEKPQVLKAFEKAYQNIYAFHKRQIPQGFETEISANRLGYKFIPFDSVALYVPGGLALYPSTVLMGITPAAIAGVEDIVLLSPPSANGMVADIVQSVAYIAGAKRILQAGGAQAVFAAAYGIKELDLQPVDYIYGPGNIYVAVAKNYVFSQNLCGIDGFAGPSEVLLIADESAKPSYLANDFLAQAEHDQNAIAVLLVTDEQTAVETVKEIEKAIEERPERKHITEEAVRRNGRILLCDSLEQAVEFSNRFAPEHLEIQTQENDWLLERVKAAGSVFAGDYAPVALGDYFSGTNHILPTNRGARFGSGVSVQSFYRRLTYQVASREGLEISKEPITLMSKEEGLFNEHGYSVLCRFED